MMARQLLRIAAAASLLSCHGCDGNDGGEANGPVGSATWQRSIGGSGSEYASAVVPSRGGGYVIAGYTNSIGAGGSDAYLIKLDELGNTVWERTYGGADDDAAQDAIATDDGGYLLAGYTRSSGAGSADVYLVKTDSVGGVAWETTVGTETWERANALASAPDGGYVVAGMRVAKREIGGIPLVEWDAFLIKVDGSGDFVWEQIYADSGDNENFDVVATDDGGFVVAGEMYPTPTGGWDAFLMKTDASGRILWRSFFGGPSNDGARGVISTRDGGYVLCGSSLPPGANAPGVYIAKADGAGNLIWEQVLAFTVLGSAASAIPAVDGGYLAAGMSSAGGAGGLDGYLVKISEGGTPVWRQYYGGLYEEQLSAITVSANGGYVAVGSTESFSAGETDVFVIKVNADGSL